MNVLAQIIWIGLLAVAVWAHRSHHTAIMVLALVTAGLYLLGLGVAKAYKQQKTQAEAAAQQQPEGEQPST